MKAIIKKIMSDKKLVAKMQRANIGQSYLYTLSFTGRLCRGMLAGL